MRRLRRKAWRWATAIRERWDLAKRLSQTEYALKVSKAVAANAHRFNEELSLQSRFAQTQYVNQEAEMRALLNTAETIFMECPKGPIAMGDVLRWRSDYRAFRKHHAPIRQ